MSRSSESLSPSSSFTPVTASPPQSGSHRNVLGYGNIKPRLTSAQLEQGIRRTPGNVSRAIRHPLPAAGYPDTRCIRLGDDNFIAEIDTLHDHSQFMVTVRPAAQDIKPVINLRRGLEMQCFHKVFLQMIPD
jgi:hypothetical protein